MPFPNIDFLPSNILQNSFSCQFQATILYQDMPRFHRPGLPPLDQVHLQIFSPISLLPPPHSSGDFARFPCQNSKLCKLGIAINFDPPSFKHNQTNFCNCSHSRCLAYGSDNILSFFEQS